MPDDDAPASARPPCPFAMVAIDLDGTLIDTVGDLHAATVRMQRPMGIAEASPASVRDWIGNGIERLVHRALTGSMDDEAAPARFEEGLARFLTAYEQTNGTLCALYPGVASGLSWLGGLHVPLVCVTNKAGRFSRPLIDALGIAGRFAHHIAGDDVAAKKPAPDALLEAARRCRVAPGRCALIGDSVSDIRAARAAGFTAIGVSYGYNHGRPMRDLEGDLRPDAIVDSFSELPDVFRRFASEGISP